MANVTYAHLGGAILSAATLNYASLDRALMGYTALGAVDLIEITHKSRTNTRCCTRE